MKITFIQTGGTIDKEYPRTESNHGYNFEIGDPASIDILKHVVHDFESEHTQLLKKDSLDLTNEDRNLILETIRATDNDRIIVTHGTDTILKTAEHLSDIEDKIIILTGALIPESFKNSDADFNLGMAIGAAHSLSTPGIYVALYGSVTAAEEFAELERRMQ